MLGWEEGSIAGLLLVKPAVDELLASFGVTLVGLVACCTGFATPHCVLRRGCSLSDESTSLVFCTP